LPNRSSKVWRESFSLALAFADGRPEAGFAKMALAGGRTALAFATALACGKMALAFATAAAPTLAEGRRATGGMSHHITQCEP
jgi:hypothetical protein